MAPPLAESPQPRKSIAPKERMGLAGVGFLDEFGCLVDEHLLLSRTDKTAGRQRALGDRAGRDSAVWIHAPRAAGHWRGGEDRSGHETRRRPLRGETDGRRLSDPGRKNRGSLP